jgi:hypothetical protein
LRRNRVIGALTGALTFTALVTAPVAAEPATGRMDAAVSTAAGVTAPAPKGKARIEPLRTDSAGRVIVYVEGGNTDALRSAVRNAGGQVSDADGRRVRAAVRPDALADLAKQPGVTEIRKPEAPVAMEVVSEGVQPSGAPAWHTSGNLGAGAKVGIIDEGYGLLADAQAAGEVPANTTVYNGQCSTGDTTTHGTSMAEIVHDMAPQAQLYLACVTDSMGFDDAAHWLKDQGVSIVNVSIGFPGTGRGNGVPEAGTPAATVAWLRTNGIVVVAAAGNEGDKHMTGRTADPDGNGWMNIAGAAENQGFTLGPGPQVTIELKWDAWSRTTEDLDLYVMDTPAKPTGPNDPHLGGRYSLRPQQSTPGGLTPVETITFSNQESFAQTYWIYVKINNPVRQTLRYDLTAYGPASGLAYVDPAGSIAEPASSPYAIAVGAITPANAATGTVESYSGRGPSIDGRVKPDVTGFANVSTSLGRKTGTSVAAAHVSGAAALYKSANPGLDPSDLEALLLDSSSRPGSDTARGHGVLNVGAPRVPQPTPASGYTPLPNSRRLLNTLNSTGGHQGELQPGETFTLPVPGIPDNATAVQLTFNTWVFDNASKLEIHTDLPDTTRARPVTFAVDPNRQVSHSFIVRVGADRVVRLRNPSGRLGTVVDLDGYFSPDSGAKYTPRATSARVLDTRDLNGPRKNVPLGAAGAGEIMTVPIRGVAGVASNATAVSLSLSASEATGPMEIDAYGQTYSDTVSLFINSGQRRSNTTIVRIGDDGSIRLRNWPNKAHVTVDVLGWFAPGTGAGFVPTRGAEPVLDTATGTGVHPATLGRGQNATMRVTGVGDVPNAVSSVLLHGYGADKVAATGVSFFAPETGWAATPSLWADQGATAPGLAIVPVGASGSVTARNETGAIELSGDVAGYFVGGTSAASAGNCVTPADEPGFLPLFDGRPETSLGKWGVVGQQATQDGCELITSANTSRTWHPSDSFDNDYTLRVDWKATTANSQSAVIVGEARTPTPPWAAVAIGPANATPTEQTGAIKGVQAPIANAARPVGEWNTYEITVAGNQVIAVLNGVTVNRYTAPQGFSPRSLISLANHNTADPVRYRNVRVRTNRLVGSGPLRSGNLCLSLGAAFQMAACDGSAAQVWTAMDLYLHALGSCMDTQNSGTAAGTAVIATGCTGNLTQKWQAFADGRVVNLAAGRCLSYAGTALSLQDCTGQAQQTWSGIARSVVSDGLFNGSGACLNVTGRVVADGAAVQVAAPCPASLSSSWTQVPDGSVRALGRCLDLANGAVADGTLVQMWTCNGASSQQWRLRPDSGLVNAKSGTCLDSTAGTGQLSIQPCAATPVRTWRNIRLYANWGRIMGIVGKCVDVAGNVDANGTAVNLSTCTTSPGQQILLTADGAIHMKSRCLDLTGGATADDTPIQLFDCNGGNGQKWTMRPDGLIENPVSGRCLGPRGGGSADGTRLVIMNCADQSWQRWALPFE